MSQEPRDGCRIVHADVRVRVIAWAMPLFIVLLVGCGGSEVSAPDGLLATVLSDPVPEFPTATAGASVTALPTESVATVTATATATIAPSPTATATAPAPTPTMSPIPSEAEPAAPVIVLDPGHDRTTPGALGVEYQINLRTALIAQAALEEAGYEVHLTRTDNETVFVEDASLLPEAAEDFHPGYSHAYAHASKALGFEPDMVILLHYNGHSDPDVSRLEVYYCENGGPQNLVLAEIIRDELVVALNSIGFDPPSAVIQEDIVVARGGRHFPSLGNVYDAPRTFRHNRYEGIPVVLTEPLYLTNATGFDLLEDEATHQAIAETYVRAADRYFGR